MTLTQHPENTTNQAAFDRLLPQLRASCPHGHYALIAQGVFLGTFASYAEALAKGYAISETDVFFVKQIESPSEGIHRISTPFQTAAGE
jgi:hypothetical protein